MITTGMGSPLPPRKPKRPNNRTPLTSSLPTVRRAPQTPKVNRGPVLIPRLYASTAAPAAVGQKSARQPNIPTSLYTPTIGVKPVKPKFYTGLSNIILPLSGFDPSSISSDYGPRTHPVTGRYSNHTGIDLPGVEGTPVRAAANGIVIGAVANDSVYGNQVILGHGREKNTMYGHMTNFTVQEGQKVKAGDIIGYVGSTGMSTGPHLHWETWANGRPVNPMIFIGGN